MGIKSLIAVGAMAVMSVASAAKAATIDVDLMFVIDRSGSMDDEGATLADQIGEVIDGLAADDDIGSVFAGVVSYASNSSSSTGAQVVSGLTDDAAALETSIDGITYGGRNEDGLGAMSQSLPGGSLSLGWRNNTVKSLVLLTDEDDDGPAPNDYSAFQQTLIDRGILNNVIVSNLNSRCDGLGGSSTRGGCEYIGSTNPTTGAAFDLVDFVDNTEDFLKGFISTKIAEIENTDPTPGDGAVVPLPAGAWLMLAGIGALGVVRRRQQKTAA